MSSIHERGSKAMPPGHTIKPRAPRFPVPENIDKHWLAGNAFKTHWLNSYTLIIPEGEKFILRTTKRFFERIEPSLRERVVGLLGQEISHSREHERFFATLTAQGYRIRRFLSFYALTYYGVLERTTRFTLGTKVLLATAAAIEHINALIAEVGLSDGFLAGADPSMRPLFEWHYAEEIEHKDVVYDVLQQVAPSYAVRAIGMAFAVMVFMSSLAMGTVVLLAQDGLLFSRTTLRDAWRFLFSRERFGSRLVRAVRDYLRPGFHPDQHDCDHLAWEVLERLGTGLGHSL